MAENAEIASEIIAKETRLYNKATKMSMAESAIDNPDAIPDVIKYVSLHRRRYTRMLEDININIPGKQQINTELDAIETRYLEWATINNIPLSRSEQMKDTAEKTAKSDWEKL